MTNGNSTEQLRDKWKLVDGDCREGDDGLITYHVDAFDEGYRLALSVCADGGKGEAVAYAVYRARPDENDGKEFFYAAHWHNDYLPQAGERIVAGHFVPGAAPQAECAPRADEKRCEYCDGTGMVHRADGEYLGECTDCAPRADEMKLDKPAQVSGTRFGKGIKWSTVIGAAQRYYEFMQTPDGKAVRIENARSFLDDLRNAAGASNERAKCKLCNSTGHETPCAYPTEINRQQAETIQKLKEELERADAAPNPSDAAITACALMIKGICMTKPQDECTALIKKRIQFMLKSAERADAEQRRESDGALSKDADRLNWLCEQVINVRLPLPYGSRDMFWASPTDDDGGHEPSDLRAQIDSAILAANKEPQP